MSGKKKSTKKKKKSLKRKSRTLSAQDQITWMKSLALHYSVMSERDRLRRELGI